jgi:hypothetical protein
VRVERWLVAGGLLLFGFSLLLPAVEGSGFPALSGLDMLRQGAGAWRDQVVAWYANPVLWSSLFCTWFGRYRIGLGLGALGMLLALSSFTAATMAGDAGRSVPEFRFAIGFYVWLVSIVAAVLAAAFGVYRVSARSGHRVTPNRPLFRD